MADVLAALDRAQLDGSADAALELALQAARVTTAPGGRASVATRVEDLLGRPRHDAVLASRALVWSVSHLPADVDDREAFATWTLERVQQAIRTARTSGDAAALLDALELTIRTLPLTLDMELARAGIAEGLELAERHDDPGRLARFRMWVGMGALSQGQVEPAEGLLLAAFAGGSAAGDRVAADYSAIFLRAMGVTDSGVPGLPLPELAGPPGVRVAAPGRVRRRHGPGPARHPQRWMPVTSGRRPGSLCSCCRSAASRVVRRAAPLRDDAHRAGAGARRRGRSTPTPLRCRHPWPPSTPCCATRCRGPTTSPTAPRSTSARTPLPSDGSGVIGEPPSLREAFRLAEQADGPPGAAPSSTCGRRRPPRCTRARRS